MPQKIYSAEQLAKFLEDHRQLFEDEYLSTLGKNSATISKEDLDEIQAHLEGKKAVVAPKILKRIRNPKSPMFLMPFPNGHRYVCRSEEGASSDGNRVSQSTYLLPVQLQSGQVNTCYILNLVV